MVGSRDGGGRGSWDVSGMLIVHLHALHRRPDLAIILQHNFFLILTHSHPSIEHPLSLFLILLLPDFDRIYG